MAVDWGNTWDSAGTVAAEASTARFAAPKTRVARIETGDIFIPRGSWGRLRLPDQTTEEPYGIMKFA
jgi:hypothetical protein